MNAAPCVKKAGVGRRLFAEAARFWPLLLAGLVASGLASVFETSLPVIIGQVIDVLAEKKHELLFNLLLLGVEKPRLAVINFLPAWVLLVILLSGAFAFLRSYLISDAGQRVIFRVRGLMYNHLLALPLRFYDVRQSGEVVARHQRRERPSGYRQRPQGYGLGVHDAPYRPGGDVRPLVEADAPGPYFVPGFRLDHQQPRPEEPPGRSAFQPGSAPSPPCSRSRSSPSNSSNRSAGRTSSGSGSAAATSKPSALGCTALR